MTDQGPIEVIARGVLTRDDAVLLCWSQIGGYAYLPGGHVEAGESGATALRREFLEETGETVEVGAPLLVAEVRFHDGRIQRHEINLVFHVEHADPTPPERIASREGPIDFRWAPPLDAHRDRSAPRDHSRLALHGELLQAARSSQVDQRPGAPLTLIPTEADTPGIAHSAKARP